MEKLPSRLRGPSATRRQALGSLMLAGGLLAGITVILPPHASGSDALIIGCGALALIFGAALLAIRRPVPEPLIGLAVALGTVLITLATREGGTDAGTGDNQMLYVWVCLFSFCFLSVPHALGQLAMVGVAYAWLLGQQGVPTDAAATQWVVTLGTLLIAGLVVARLRGWLEHLVGALSDRARTDGLTSLLNREAFEERASVEFLHAARNGTQTALLVADLDGFKAINDSLGHHAGDQVLQRVAMVLDTNTRSVDLVARTGGDEFLILLPGATAVAAKEVAERLRLAVRRASGEIRVQLTLSVGVAVGFGAERTLDALWQQADEAMYEAKRGGGDSAAVARRQPVSAAAGAAPLHLS
jgi:diguanylate cyclase (GGDEF)-like protein